MSTADDDVVLANASDPKNRRPSRSDVLPYIPIGHPDTMMSVESVRRAVEEFRVQESDVVVATFSKTGTTLVTWLAHLIRIFQQNNKKNENSINSLKDVETHLASLETFYQVVPWPLLSWDIGYDPNAATLWPPRIFKSHLRLASVYPNCRKVVVTLRDPQSTTNSFFHFLRAKQVLSVLALESVSEFLLTTPFVKGRPGRASLWEYYREYHAVLACPEVLILIYEDLVRDMPTEVRRLAQFMSCEYDNDIIDMICTLSTKEHMAKHNSLFDEPYERAKALGRVGDLSQLAPGAKVASNKTKSSDWNDAALQCLTDQWQTHMAPLGYDAYDDLCAAVRKRNQELFPVSTA